MQPRPPQSPPAGRSPDWQPPVGQHDENLATALCAGYSEPWLLESAGRRLRWLAGRIQALEAAQPEVMR